MSCIRFNNNIDFGVFDFCMLNVKWLCEHIFQKKKKICFCFYHCWTFLSLLWLYLPKQLKHWVCKRDYHNFQTEKQKKISCFFFFFLENMFTQPFNIQKSNTPKSISLLSRMQDIKEKFTVGRKRTNARQAKKKNFYILNSKLKN